MADRVSAGGKRFLFWLAVALPFVVYVGSIGLAEAKRRGAPQIEVKIEGYDPRDPFRGHYLQYRIAVQGPGDERGYWGYACAGAPAPRLRPVYRYDQPPAPEDCEIELPVEFTREAHRFYVQQDRGRELEEALRDGRASVRLRVVSSRQVMVEQLLVDGKPIR